jgi:DNA-directed RNA polymerase sigma subunit (sigma70/sigma32)
LVAKAREYNVTLDTLATTMGVSRARVQQIESAAGK